MPADPDVWSTPPGCGNSVKIHRHQGADRHSSALLSWRIAQGGGV